MDHVLVGGRSTRRTQSARTTTAVAVVAASFAIFAGAALADVAPGTDFRVSNSGVDGDTSPGAFNPDVAYNSTTNQYLIVWYGDGDNTFDYEIYGQRIDANGNEIGGDFRISDMDPPGNLSRVALDPAVAYNPAAPSGGEYLVIWYGDGLPTDNEYEIWGQRLSATGTELGSDFRISNMGPDNSTSRTALRDPEVTYNAQANEYLAVWAGNSMQFFDKYEIWGQRISAAGAQVTGTAETQCADSIDNDSDGFTNDGCAAVAAPETVCHDTSDNDSDGTINDGCPVNTDDRISNTGSDTDPSRDADKPAVAYNSQNGQYTVAWYGNPTGATGEYEIYGQLLSQAGAEVGGDFRISNVGADGDGLREPGPVPPAIAYNSVDNQYLVTWYGNDPPLATAEYEIFGQRLSAAGAEVGGDFRISNVGADGDTARNTFDPAVTYDSTDNEYLVAWYGDIGAEIEVCGQRVDSDGSQLGGDVRLSNMGPDNDATRAGFFPALAWNSTANEYLATWYGDETNNEEFEVYARRAGPDQPCASGVTRAPPTITSVGHNSRRLTASWTLPTGLSSIAIEAATSPATDAAGRFTQGVVISEKSLSAGAASYQSPSELAPGTYYVHVAGYNAAAPSCANPQAAACVWEFSPASTVTIPSDASPPPPPPGGNNKAPDLSVSGASTQRALRAKAILVRATCDQACTVTASGSLTIPGASKTYRLRSVKRSLAAGRRVTLRLKLSSKVIRTARRALRKRKRVRATVRLTAQNSTGKKTSRKVIRITG